MIFLKHLCWRVNETRSHLEITWSRPQMWHSRKWVGTMIVFPFFYRLRKLFGRNIFFFALHGECKRLKWLPKNKASSNKKLDRLGGWKWKTNSNFEKLLYFESNTVLRIIYEVGARVVGWPCCRLTHVGSYMLLVDTLWFFTNFKSPWSYWAEIFFSNTSLFFSFCWCILATLRDSSC